MRWPGAMQAIKANGSTEFYLPYKGHESAKDFMAFCNDDKILFAKDAAKEKLYQKH